MFGKNEKLKQIKVFDGTYAVKEVFATIQGEGPFTGMRSVFVRLAGCHLACWFCDTDFEQDIPAYSTDAICKQVALVGNWPGPKLVVITGGEPMRQPIGELCEALLEQGCIVQIETAGSLWTPLPDSPRLHIVVSPKTAFVAPEIIERASAWKYVVQHGHTAADGLPEYDMQHPDGKGSIARPAGSRAPIFLSPMDEGDADKNRANRQAVAAAALEFGYIAAVQLHKTLGVP